MMARPALAPALLLALAAGAGAQLPRSLIGQGGFEGTLEGWEPQGGVALDAAVAHGGKSSVGLTGPSALRTPLIPYTGEFVHLSFSIRTQDVRRGPQPWNQAGLQVSWYDAERKPLDHADLGLTVGTTDWTQHEGRYFWEEKEGVAFFRVSLMIWEAEGKAWFDDVTVEATEPPEAFRKVPLLREVEDQPPRLWPPSPLQPATAPVDVGTMEVNFSPDRDFFLRPADPGAPTLTRLDVRLAGTGETPGASESGYEVAAGWYYRYRSRIESQAGYPALEVHDEFFRGSPILSQFVRLYLANGSRVGELEISFRAPSDLTRLSFFRGNTLYEGPLEGAEVTYRFGRTPKPFLILHTPEDTSGLVIYHPLPAEIRRWHVEDYLVEARPDVLFRAVRDGDACTASWDFRDLQAGPGGYEHSFDLALFLMPYSGTVKQALDQFRTGAVDLTEDQPPLGAGLPEGYWTERMPAAVDGARLLRLARYHPREFASWVNGSDVDCYGHRNGHVWGAMTQQMKGVRVDPLAERALARDHAARMLGFFLERANEHGAPPDLSTWRELAARLPNPSDYYRHVFCQYWEYRLGEFRRLMQSPRLQDPEKEAVYQRLQRAANVFDPTAPGSWTLVLPEGGYWFAYLDLPLWQHNPFVINTHATSVGVAGEFARLAEETGHQDDAEWWAEVFRKGVDGLLYAFRQDWMWYGDAHDPNELRYARTLGGPRSYHTYMTTAWLPQVIRLARELGNYHVAELVQCERRLMQAKFVQGDPALKIAQDFLAGLGQEKP